MEQETDKQNKNISEVTKAELVKMLETPMDIMINGLTPTYRIKDDSPPKRLEDLIKPK